MRHSFHDTRTGAEVDEHAALDGSGCVRNGFMVRTRIALMDRATDSTSLDALIETRNAMTSDTVAKYNERISNAWRSPPLLAVDKTPVEEPIVRDRAPDMATVYANADRRLQNAWRY
jgi:hypothetical protein